MINKEKWLLKILGSKEYIELWDQINDDNKLARKINNKRNTNNHNIPITLTHLDILLMMKEANIKSSQWSRKIKNGYDIARYGDTGVYSKENCRFITHKENVHEMQIYKESQIKKEKQLEQRRDFNPRSRVTNTEWNNRLSIILFWLKNNEKKFGWITKCIKDTGLTKRIIEKTCSRFNIEFRTKKLN